MRTADEICRRLAGRLEQQVDALTDHALSWMIRNGQLPSWMREQPLWDQAVDSSRDSIRAELQILRAGGELPSECPLADRFVVQQSVQAGWTPSLLIDGYRAGHRSQWEAFERLLDEEDLEPTLEAAVRQRGSDFFFAYAGRLSALVTDEFMAERDRQRRSSDRLKLSAIRALLAGQEPDPGGLDYPVEGHHIALTGTGREVLEPLADAARQLDARLLVLDIFPDPWWAWLGRRTPFERAGPAQLLQLEVPVPDRLGIGSEEVGADGFRESHRQAFAAHRGTAPGDGPLAYREIALLDLASRDPDAARAFVAAELGEIGGQDSRSRRLRTTLEAYFTHGLNARSTAKALGIHHQTVSQHLEAIEQRTGSAVGQRRAELEVALKLERYLDADPGQ